MIFHRTDIVGVFIIEPEPVRDERGSFSRLYCRQEWAAHGLNPTLEQCSLSRNTRLGTVRGLHYQRPPFAECKLVRCVGGAAFDVVLDIRRDSPSFGQHLTVPLTADGAMVYVPEGCAHGFQTVANDTTILYMMSSRYDSTSARGVLWNDPALGIPWPLPDTAIVSERDRALPSLDRAPFP